MAIDEFAFTPTDGLNNQESFPTDPANEAAARKQIQDVFNQVKDYINNTLLARLASITDGASGGDNLGMTAIYEGGASTAQGILEELKQAIIDIALGDIPADSLTEAKMAAEMKKQAGGVAAFDTVASHMADYASYVADNEYPLATVASQQIQVTHESDSTVYKFKLATDVTGGAITISEDGGTSDLPLLDIDGDPITDLDKGFVEVIKDAANFIYRPRGRVLEFYDVYRYTTLTLLNNVPAGYYVYSNEKVLVDNGEVSYLQDTTTSAQAISGGDYDVAVKDRAFDNNETTSWQSSQTGSNVSGNAYIGQNYGSAKNIGKIRIKQAGTDVSGITSAKVQYSDNGSSWSDSQIITLVITANWQEFIITPLSHQYWRLLANSNTTSGSWAVLEMEMHEAIDGQIIPSIDEAADKSQLQVVTAGALKSYGTTIKNYSGFANKEDLWEAVQTWLYDQGGEFTQITGGWVAGYSEGNGSLTKETDRFNLIASNPGSSQPTVYGYRTYVTNLPIDLTNINQIKVDWAGVETGNYGYGLFYIGPNKDDPGLSAGVSKSGTFSRTIDTVDVSALSGNYYIKLIAWADRDMSVSTFDLDVFRVWGE